ncbi:hypothetical protein RHGRI_012479 [Rhododendron griersonianum]|uniref:Auxin-responsive protein n=1 Tax=Rhododendron griersonianum TaxID=479676 RepID=A0AAV6KRU0_9ERIC|nr:hypothetical protein RHGRI_012479 [Rhododendron griersonianum]
MELQHAQVSSYSCRTCQGYGVLLLDILVMFIDSCKRMRIMKGSEAIGLACKIDVLFGVRGCGRWNSKKDTLQKLAPRW